MLYPSTWYALLVVLVLFLVYYFKHSTVNTFQVYSKVDQEYYNVHRNFPNTEEAADRLARLNQMNIKLLRYVKGKLNSNRYNPEQREIIKFLLSNYNPDVIVENSPTNVESDTSYTKNKGELLAVCIRQKEKEEFGEFPNENTLLFVVIHEMAHMATTEYGHEKAFWKNFKFLLHEAVEAGIYEPVDYSMWPVQYCGMKINSSPLFRDYS